MRAVLDANVIISAALSPKGAPGQLLRLWVDGAFDIVVSPRLLDELSRALDQPKLKQRVPSDQAAELIELLAGAGILGEDSDDPPARSRDPDDDYLISLASTCRALLVTGDQDLLKLSDRIPVRSPGEFLVQVLDS